MTATSPGGERLLSIGGAAQLLNVSPSLLRKLERRVYSISDVEAIRAARAGRCPRPPGATDG